MEGNSLTIKGCGGRARPGWDGVLLGARLGVTPICLSCCLLTLGRDTPEPPAPAARPPQLRVLRAAPRVRDLSRARP